MSGASPASAGTTEKEPEGASDVESEGDEDAAFGEGNAAFGESGLDADEGDDGDELGGGDAGDDDDDGDRGADREPDSDAFEDSDGAEDRPSSGPSSLARYDALDAYMREVQRHPLLSPEDEHQLAAEYVKTGSVDLAAGFDHVVYGGLFFAVVIAIILALGWRFFDRGVNDPWFDPKELPAVLEHAKKFPVVEPTTPHQQPVHAPHVPDKSRPHQENETLAKINDRLEDSPTFRQGGIFDAIASLFR